MHIASHWDIDEGVIKRTVSLKLSPNTTSVSFRSISVLLTLDLLLNILFSFPFKVFIAHVSHFHWTLLIRPPGKRLICLHSNSERESHSQGLTREQSALYPMFSLTCWDRSPIYVSFPYIFLPFIGFVFIHYLSLHLFLSLYFPLNLLTVFPLSPVCPSVSLFFYTSLSASRDPFRVLCNVHFSFLIHWEVFNLPICYQSLRGIHMKEMNNMFPLNAVHSQKRYFSFTAVDD